MASSPTYLLAHSPPQLLSIAPISPGCHLIFVLSPKLQPCPHLNPMCISLLVDLDQLLFFYYRFDLYAALLTKGRILEYPLCSPFSATLRSTACGLVCGSGRRAREIRPGPSGDSLVSALMLTFMADVAPLPSYRAANQRQLREPSRESAHNACASSAGLVVVVMMVMMMPERGAWRSSTERPAWVG